MDKHQPVEYEGYSIRPQNTTVRGKAYDRFVVEFGKTPRGNRSRRTFVSVAKAKAGIREHLDRSKANSEAQGILQKKIGEKAKGLSADDLLDAARGLEILDRTATLADACSFYITHTTPPGGSKLTIAELCEKYRVSREKAGRSPYTVRDIYDCLRPFSIRFGGMQVAELTTSGIESWFDDHNGGPTRKRKIRNHLVSVFNFAMKRGYRKDNPAAPIPVPTKVKATPYVMPTEDVEAVMRYTSAQAPEMVPYMALCLFAGIRPMGEMERINWKDIDFGRRAIFISDAVSKTGDERIVKMTDTLVAWLADHRLPEGSIYFSNMKMKRIRKRAGIRWATDCMRHSFGSYHLAMWQNRGDTAEQMGHSNIRILFNHYHRAVRSEDAERFWNIRPEIQDNVINYSRNVG